MGTRHPLYDQMAAHDISLSYIARMVDRSPSTIQKQLTGVNPLKSQIEQAILTAIAQRRAEVGVAVEPTARSSATGSAYEAAIAEKLAELGTVIVHPMRSSGGRQHMPDMTCRPRGSRGRDIDIDVKMAPREALLAGLENHLYCIETVELLLSMNGLESIADLKTAILKQVETVRQSGGVRGPVVAVSYADGEDASDEEPGGDEETTRTPVAKQPETG